MQQALGRADLMERAKAAYRITHVHDIMEAGGIPQYSTAKAQLELQRELEPAYFGFRLEMQNSNALNGGITDINSTIRNANDGSLLADYLKKQDVCILEKVTVENRIRAIDLLETKEEAEQITRLIESIKYNGQAQQLLDKIFQNNSGLFFRLWHTIDGSDFSKYTNYFKTLTEQLALSAQGYAQ